MYDPRHVFVLMLLFAAVAGCSSSRAEAPPKMPPPEVSVARVETRVIRDWSDVTGRLQAVNTVALHPRVSGYIDGVYFTEGARVKQGALLFRIDPRPFQQQVSRLEAERRRARSQLELSKSDSERAQRLLDSGAISNEGRDRLVAAHAEAEASLAAVDAQLAAARLDLEFTSVRSPIAGRASRAEITRGNLVSSASTLTTIVSDGDMHVVFELDEAAYLKLVHTDERVHSVEMGLTDEAGFPRTGTLDFVDNQVDPRTGTIRVRAVFPNADGRLVPGLFARVRLEGGKPAEALLIDDKAVLTDQDRKYVYVLDAQGRAQRKPIAIGRVFDGLRVVSSGLSAGDKVIVYGVQKVFFPGMPVRAAEIAMGAPPPQAPAM